MNEFIKPVELQLIEDINRDNEADIKEGQVEFKKWLPSSGKEVDLLLKGKDLLFGSVPTRYNRLSIFSFFRGVPVRLPLDKLPDPFSGQDIVNLLNTYWPTILLEEDLRPSFLTTYFQHTVESATIHIQPESRRWTGSLQVFFVATVIDINSVWKEKARIYPRPPAVDLVYTYGVDFSPYGKFLDGLTEESLDYEFIISMIKPGIKHPKFTDFKFMFNGKRDEVPAPYTGTTRPDMSNVMMMVNKTDAAEILFIHYNLN